MQRGYLCNVYAWSAFGEDSPILLLHNGSLTLWSIAHPKKEPNEGWLDKYRMRVYGGSLH